VCVILLERCFYAFTSAHCSGVFMVFGSPLAAIRGQGHSVSRGPKYCALRSDRRMALVPCQPGIDKFLGLLSNPGGFTRILGRSPIMNKKFVVRLSAEERSQLESLVAKGKAAARRLTRARILLKADCSPLGPAWSDEQISDALDLGAITVHRVRRSFVEGGLDGALVRRPVPRRPRLLDGDQEAHLIALACGSPPAGRCRWTLRLLADRLVELGHVGTASHETIRRTLKKTS
jgi:transposase